MKSALLLKSAVYALLIVYVVKNNFAWFPVSIFLIGSFALYVQPVFKTIPYLFSFVLLIASTLLSLAVFGEAVPLGILALIFAFLFYLLLGIKQVVFRTFLLQHFLCNCVDVFCYECAGLCG